MPSAHLKRGAFKGPFQTKTLIGVVDQNTHFVQVFAQKNAIN